MMVVIDSCLHICIDRVPCNISSQPPGFDSSGGDLIGPSVIGCTRGLSCICNHSSSSSHGLHYLVSKLTPYKPPTRGRADEVADPVNCAIADPLLWQEPHSQPVQIWAERWNGEDTYFCGLHVIMNLCISKMCKRKVPLPVTPWCFSPLFPTIVSRQQVCFPSRISRTTSQHVLRPGGKTWYAGSACQSMWRDK